MSKHTAQRFDPDSHMFKSDVGDYVLYADVKPLIDALADRDPSRLGELEKAVEQAASVFQRMRMHIHTAQLRATLAAFRTPVVKAKEDQ